MAVTPGAASREATKHAGLCAEMDGEGAGNAMPAVCGHHARHALHAAIAASARGAAPSMPQLITFTRSCGALEYLSRQCGCPPRHSVSRVSGTEARPLTVLQCRLIVVQPQKHSASKPSSGLHDENTVTSGMPTPKLMSWLG